MAYFKPCDPRLGTVCRYILVPGAARGNQSKKLRVGGWTSEIGECWLVCGVGVSRSRGVGGSVGRYFLPGGREVRGVGRV